VIENMHARSPSPATACAREIALSTRHERNKEVPQLATDLEPIREILAQHGRLSQDARQLDADANLHEAGLTSLATVSIMLALEDHFNVEFPESMLSRKTFESLESIAEAVAKLVG
jgi:acyl carrier protein